MKITWKDLTVKCDHLDHQQLLETWTWLVGNDKLPILMSSIGDLFLKNPIGNCFWLDVGVGEINKIAENEETFKAMLKDDNQVDQWFLLGLVEKLKVSGFELTENKVFSYKVLPVLGGEYLPENFELTDIQVHFQLNGLIHQKIKGLPNGTKVKFSVDDGE